MKSDHKDNSHESINTEILISPADLLAELFLSISVAPIVVALRLWLDGLPWGPEYTGVGYVRWVGV